MCLQAPTVVNDDGCVGVPVLSQVVVSVVGIRGGQGVLEIVHTRRLYCMEGRREDMQLWCMGNGDRGH